MSLTVVPKLLDSGGLDHLVASDSPSMSPRTVSHRLRRLLLKLVLRCDKLPRALFLSNIHLSSAENQASMGGFSDIFIGMYGVRRVAIKRLRVFQIMESSKRATVQQVCGLADSSSLSSIDHFARHDQSFYHEAITWRNLRHRHILPFLGIDDKLFFPSLCMISPWMEHGAIRNTVDKLKTDQGVSQRTLYAYVQRWVSASHAHSSCRIYF